MEDQKKAYQIFSSFKQQYYDENNTKKNFGNTGGILNMDEDIKIIIQRINKKSKKTTTTRVKALQQLQEILGQKDQEYIERFIKLFMIIYEKILMGEIDTKVLVELHKCMGLIIEKNIKEVQKNFSSIFPLLFFATFEPNPEIAGLSRQNLKQVLKDDTKIAKAIFMFKDKIKELVAKIIRSDESFIKEVSVYDEKEINDIIHVKLLAMTFNFAANVIKLSNELSEAERDQVHTDLVESMCKDEKDSQKIIGLFNTHKQSHVIRSAIVNFFSKLFQFDYAKYLDKKQIKNIMTLFLVDNLNDDNMGAQKYYWEEGFILKLLKQVKNYGIDMLSLESQLADLFKISGFAGGEPYYRSLPELITILLADKNRQKATKLVIKLINTHFEAIAANEFKFDIETHFKCGFKLIDTLLANLESSEDKSKIKDLLVNDVLLKLVEIFINNNNPKQRNLLVLGVNNSKHIPTHLLEYIISCESSSKYNDVLNSDFPQAVVSNLNALLESKVIDKDKMLNYGILGSTLLKSYADKQDKISNKLLVGIFQKVHNMLKQTVNSVTDVDFEAQNIQLSTLRLFFVEMFIAGNAKALIKINSGESELHNALHDFVSFVSEVYKTDVIDNKLDNKLIDRTSQMNYKFLLGSFVKIPFEVADYDNILLGFNSKIQQKAIGNVSSIHDLITFLTDALSLQTINTLLNGEDTNGEIANAIDSKFWLKSDFMTKICRSNAFELLFASIFKYTIVYKSYQLIPVLVGYIEKDMKFAELSLQLLDDLKNEPKNFNFSGYEESVYKFLVLILKHLQAGETPQFNMLLVDILKQNKYAADDVLLQEFDQISDKTQLLVFQDLLNQALDARVEIKFVQRFITDIILNNAKVGTLSDIFYEFTVKCIHNLNLEDIEVAEVYRRISKKITNVVDMDKIIDQILKASDNGFNHLISLFCQSSIIKNLTVSKRRIFWHRLIFEKITTSIANTAASPDFNIAELYGETLKASFENVFMQKFCFHLMKYLLKEDSTVPDSVKWCIFDVTLFTLQDTSYELIVPLFEEFHASMSSFITKHDIYDKFTHVTSPKSPLLALQGYIFDSKKEKADTIDQNIVDSATDLLEKLNLNDFQAAESVQTQLTVLVYLQFVDLCFTKDRQDIISGQIEFLEKSFSTVLRFAEQKFVVAKSQNTFVQLLVLLRKLIHIIEVFSDDLQKTLLVKILQLSFHFASTFQTLSSEKFTVPPEKFIEEIAETISRFALRENSTLSIDDIIALMGSDVNSLKKSCYFLLNQFKDFKELQKDTLIRLQEEEIDVDTVLLDLPKQIKVLLVQDNQFDNFTYFLLWGFILKSMTEGQNSNKNTYSFFQEVFKQKKEAYVRLLDRIFLYLKQKQLNDRQVIELLSHIDFRNPDMAWGETIDEKTKEAFAINCFLLFSSKFPKNLRKWIEHSDKNLSNIALLMLKQGINKAIFDLEVDQIELSQYSWKTDDFNIYIYKKSREIYAVFSQDDTCIEVVLQVPENYPVNLIEVELSKEAKLPKHKIQKYVLQIKKLLTNQNYSIIEALMHWKNNIENEFAGIQPCSICYYVLHESSKRVPNKACRTCKNKFHTDCIHKWFQTSNKSECPLCKSQFL